MNAFNQSFITGQKVRCLFNDGNIYFGKIKELKELFVIVHVNLKDRAFAYSDIFSEDDPECDKRSKLLYEIWKANRDLDSINKISDTGFDGFLGTNSGQVGNVAYGVMESGILIQSRIAEHVEGGTILKSLDGEEFFIPDGDLYDVDADDGYTRAMAVSGERRRHTGCTDPDLA